MKLNKLFFLGLILLVASAISAQDVISANELAKISKNKDVVIVWAGSVAGYKVHITGSVSVPHSTLYNNEPVKSVIKPAAEMAALLGAKGISTDKTIVVYDEGSGRYSGRVYWILKYLGAENVKMLNGNLTAWKASRKPITGSPTKSSAVTFTPKIDASVLASMEDVKNAVGNSSSVLIDARAPEEFAGTAAAEYRKGHIPGAINIEYKNVMDSKGLLKTNDQLKSLFESKGVTSDKTVIIYCETSVRAGVVHLALKGLGYPNVKVYDSAYLEWQATSSNKVE
ncbi:MAG: sulfurtransferase [Prolixibacteraceae bacterium]|jgi:thiosulfate/3-mercaptopyruvate sulfurtransferase|nr:sulfurtransferase [Prolixibacteraceae bacterium]MBT6007070.1 sulfurtransferase [Prolixibacteraceae bacterium]MBT6763134.1 sulfurtransferase [Prolixibacteraceae bacterium]MBT6999236.1 sulfurtransferase [Prolixibacteraceae bacterium]MBT7393281.1 sulfurtransferase [Prolixibacteraceae bacterium]